jgi:type II secretory pathway component GspD/PulD (secretin)
VSGGLSGGSSGGLSGGGLSSGGLSGGSSAGSSGGTAIAQPPYFFNPNRDYVYPSNAPLIVGTQGGGIGNVTPSLQIPFTNTSGTLIAPTNAVPGAGGTFGIAFLSDLEVYLFLTAAQGDNRSNVLQAPKVTTFNGAFARIFSNQVQYYVASLFPIVGVAAVAFFPSVGQIPIGVTLTVTPVVSADRRYVRMSLTPFFNALNGFTTIQIPAAVGGTGFGGGAAAINATLQLPNTTTNVVTTTVTVPDGGTVLLGGVKTLNEQRLEYGVPIFSKMPLIDRLFRNVGIGRTTTSLMLMVTPRIVILEEEEERLGIPPSVAL